MKKEFVFSAKFDTSDFDKSIEQMQQKLKAAYAPAQIAQMQQQTAGRLAGAGMSGMSAPSMEAFQKATQSARREMDSLITSQAQGQEKLGKIIAQRTEMLKKLQEQQKQVVKDSEEELKIKERIARVEANNQQLRESYKQRDMALNQTMDAKERLRPQGWGAIGSGYQSGGIMGAGRAGLGMINAGNVGAIMGGIGAVGERGAEIYRDFSKAPVRTEAAMGSAVQGTMGRQVGDIYGRRTAFEQIFAPERQRAAQQSLDTLQANKSADMWGTGFGALKNIGMGVGAGALAGGAAGMFGGPIGALGGAAIGGIAGLGKGIWDIAGDERKRSMIMSPFSQTASKRYNSMLAEDMVNDYTTSYEGQKKQNPFKAAAAGEYEQNWNRNLQAQRSMGLTNEGFYGQNGFLNNNINAGFTPEMGLEMSGSILGAGGSTRMARDSAFGNQLARGSDLTNAGQVLGTLSGGLGSSESTKQATVKILAEGMKLGLDDSKFAEEQRKFAQITAEIVARSGASGGGDFERVAGGFGRFMGENTGAGISAARTAYDQYQQISQTTTGPRGVMRAAGFMSDPALSKLSTMTKQAVMQIPEEQLNADHPVVQAAAKEAGVSADEIVKRISGTNQGAVSRFKEADTLRDKLRGYAKTAGKERLTAEDIKNAPESVRADFNKLATFQTTELGNQDQRTTVARALGTINPAEAGQGKQLGRENVLQDKLSGVDRTGRMEDTTVKAMAADSRVVLDNFNDMAPAMKKAAESTAAWTRQVRESSAALQQALEAARQNKNVDTLKAVQDSVRAFAGSGNQQQTGPKSR